MEARSQLLRSASASKGDAEACTPRWCWKELREPWRSQGGRKVQQMRRSHQANEGDMTCLFVSLGSRKIRMILKRMRPLRHSLPTLTRGGCSVRCLCVRRAPADRDGVRTMACPSAGNLPSARCPVLPKPPNLHLCCPPQGLPRVPVEAQHDLSSGSTTRPRVATLPPGRRCPRCPAVPSSRGPTTSGGGHHGRDLVVEWDMCMTASPTWGLLHKPLKIPKVIQNQGCQTELSDQQIIST